MVTVLALCLAFAAPALVLGAVFAAPGWIAAGVDAWRRRQRRLGKVIVAPGRPLEQLAADLRRLRTQRVDPGRSRVQREGARLAYEDVLRETANALGITYDLPGTRAEPAAGLGKELELLRIEQAILDAGLAVGVR